METESVEEQRSYPIKTETVLMAVGMLALFVAYRRFAWLRFTMPFVARRLYGHFMTARPLAV
jgi:hypothetical protein